MVLANDKMLMNKVLNTIPYVWYRDTSRYESFYCSLFYVLLVASGLKVISGGCNNCRSDRYDSDRKGKSVCGGILI